MRALTLLLSIAVALLLPTQAWAACGDGQLEEGEACDLGDANGPAGSCSLACTRHQCGDGTLGGVERCDDGNDRDGDGCDSDCRLEGAPQWTDSFDAGGAGGDFFDAVAHRDGSLFAIGGANERWDADRPMLARWDIGAGIAWSYFPEDEPGIATYEDVAVTRDGLIVVVGSRREPNRLRWIGSFDLDGRPVGSRILGEELAGELLAVAVTPNNQLVVGGWIDDIEQDPWLAQLDSTSLEVAWERTFPMQGRGASIADIAVSNNGKIAIAGSASAAAFPGERWVALFSSTGILRWEFHDAGLANIEASASAVAFGPGGAVYAAGSQRLTDWDEYATTQQFDFDGWVSRFDDGEETWNRREHGTASGQDWIKALAVTSSGTLVALGSTQPQPLVVQTGSDRDAVLIAYEEQGERVWKASYDGPLHVADEGAGLALGEHDEIYVAGRTVAAFEGGNAWLSEFALPLRPDPRAVDRDLGSAPPAPPVDATASLSSIPDEIETGAGTLYLNFLGGALSPGHAGDLGQAACIDAPLTFPGLPVDAEFAAEVADRVEEGLADFAVTVVWAAPPPAHVPFTTVMIGGEAPQIGLPEGAAGYACEIDCFDKEKRDIAFVFGGGDASNVAINVLHEAAHTWGLDHVENVAAVMSPFTHGAFPQWGSGCLPISEATSKASCGRVHQEFCANPNEQNSEAELLSLFGPRERDDEPPSAAIVRPAEGAIIPVGEKVEVEVEVEDNLGNAGWKLEVPSLGISRVGRGALDTISLALPAGTREIVLVATDHQGNETSVRRSVRVARLGPLPPPAERSPAHDTGGDDYSVDTDDTENADEAAPGADSSGGCSIPVAPTRPPALLLLVIVATLMGRRRAD